MDDRRTSLACLVLQLLLSCTAAVYPKAAAWPACPERSRRDSSGRAAARGAQEQARLPDRRAQTGKLARVSVSGSKKFSGEQIAAMSGLHAGDTITRDDLQAAADRLAQLGPFSGVHFRFDSRGQDVDVEFHVEDAPAYPVSFDNFPWFTDAELTEAVKAVVPFFDGTLPEEGTVLDLITEKLEKLLSTRHVRAGVEHSLLGSPACGPEPACAQPAYAGEITAYGSGEGRPVSGRRPDGPGTMMMQFRVKGASLKVGTVEFSDRLATEDKRVRERLPDLVGKAYSRFALELFVREQVLPVYLEHGYLGVRFAAPEARFTGNPNQPLPEHVLASVAVDAGPAYHWGGAEWSGNSAFGPAALDGFLGMTPGEVANGLKIQAGLDRVRVEYGRRGYLDAQLDAEHVFTRTEVAGIPVSLAAYRVRIAEGPQYRMGELVITGLSLAAERKLVAAWRIGRGEVFDKVYFEEFVERGAKQAFGDLPAHYDQIGHWLRTNPENSAVDVLLDFK
jgi:outer membrane protein assembly factor BamA